MAKNRKQAARGQPRGADRTSTMNCDSIALKPFPNPEIAARIFAPKGKTRPIPEDLYDLGFGFAYGGPRRPPRHEIDLCKIWIATWTGPRKTVNLDYGSYFLKHVVERWSGEYIPNGAFIAAAIEFGCKYIRQGPNARFNLSYKLPKKSKNRKASGWTW